MSRQYRPHRARSSPLWQCLHDSLESFTTGFYPDRSKYLGPLDPSSLLSFTCKRRGCCPSCHQRRALDTATFIRNDVCLPVPHRHWVFTIPRVLRNVSLNTSFVPPCPCKKCTGTRRPRASSTAPPAVGAPSETLNSSPAPTSSPPSTNTFRPKASKPSATMAPTAAKPEACARKPRQRLNSSLKLSPPARHKRLWRERIFAIWGCDPLKCPCCGSEMRPHKPVQDAEQIRRQLKRLGLWEPITLTKACTPRAPPSTVRWILDAHDGTVIDLEPVAAANWMPTAPRYKRERSEPVGVSETANPQAVEIQPLDDGFLG